MAIVDRTPGMSFSRIESTPRINNRTMMNDYNHRSIKIPAVHNNKEDGDDDYIARKIHQEYSRSSRSLSRTETSSRSPGKKYKSRKSRSSSGTRHKEEPEEYPLSRGRSRKSNQGYSSKERNGSRSNRGRSQSERNLTSSNSKGYSSRGHSRSERNLTSSRSRSRVHLEPMSPGSFSTASTSSSTHSGSSGSSRSGSSKPQRRLRKTRSLSSSRLMELPRESPRERNLRRSTSKRIAYEQPESETSLTDTTRSSSSSSSYNSPQKPKRIASIHTSTPSSRGKGSPSKSKSRSKSNTRSGRGRGRSSSQSGSSPLKRLPSVHSSNPSIKVTNRSKLSSIDNGNGNPSTFDGSKRVSWKSDPKLSFSDWKLHVVYRDNLNKRCVDIYHVHRNVVAYGNRKSNYLLRDIMDMQLKEIFDHNNKTEVELKDILSNGKKKSSGSKSKAPEEVNVTWLKLPNQAQADAVPMVLDFLYYTNETNQRMSADRSCNVFKVAEGLKVRALQTAIGEFYEHNLSVKNMGEFLKAATNSKANMLLAICKAKIRQMISVKPELSGFVPDEFLPDILDQSYHSNLDSTNRSLKSQDTFAQ